MQDNFKRVEKKYILSQNQYNRLREGMNNYVQPDAYANYTICNVYYDTKDMSLVRKSLEQPIYKEKLRVRSYGTPSATDTVFVEIKKKFDDVVYKRRISTSAANSIRYMKYGVLDQDSQIKREIDWCLQRYKLVPAAYIRYDREAYSGIKDPELRITFDRNLRGRDRDVSILAGQEGELLLPADETLLELKIPGAMPVWLARLLSENNIFPVSFSKYGTYYKQLIGTEPKIHEFNDKKENIRYA